MKVHLKLAGDPAENPLLTIILWYNIVTAW